MATIVGYKVSNIAEVDDALQGSPEAGCAAPSGTPGRCASARQEETKGKGGRVTASRGEIESSPT